MDHVATRCVEERTERNTSTCQCPSHSRSASSVAGVPGQGTSSSNTDVSRFHFKTFLEMEIEENKKCNCIFYDIHLIQFKL